MSDADNVLYARTIVTGMLNAGLIKEVVATELQEKISWTHPDKMLDLITVLEHAETVKRRDAVENISKLGIEVNNERSHLHGLFQIIHGAWKRMFMWIKTLSAVMLSWL